MKKLFIQTNLLLAALSFLFTSCCDTTLVAGLNRENSEACKKSEGAECYNDVFVCEGEPVYLCWTASSDVTNVDITDFGSVGKSGCKTITATVDKEYKIKATGGECERSTTVRINVITEGEKINIAASPVTDKRLLWNLKYPAGQVSPNVMVSSITPLCSPLGGCYPYAPIENYQFMDCSGKLCNGRWSGQKVNLNGGGLPSGFQVNGTTTFLPPDVPMVGEWFFTPPGNLDRNGDIKGQAFFTITAYCKKP